MTLDEAIKYEEEMVEIGETYEINKGIVEEYRQFAEWLKELKQLREQTRWIPVSDRLPKSDADVLTQYSDGSMAVDFRTASSSGWFWADEDLPIAWMPLPEPYEAESEG